MALLNYERMLNAERFCLRQLSQQLQLKKLIATIFRVGTKIERAALLDFWSAANGLKWKLNLLVKFQQILQFYLSKLLPSSSLLAVALSTSTSLLLRGPYFSNARVTEQQVQPPMK